MPSGPSIPSIYKNNLRLTREVNVINDALSLLYRL